MMVNDPHNTWLEAAEAVVQTVPSFSAPMTPLPLVSVVVPSYNQEAFVQEALDSVLATHYPALELIIINDASKQNDDQVIREWIAQHPSFEVRYIHHAVNCGVTRTLNEGIRVAQGAFVCLLAADDRLLPEGIVRRVEYLLQNPHKLAVFSDCQVIDATGTLLFESGIEGYYRSHGMIKRDLCIDALLPSVLIFHWAVPGPVFMARRELYNQLGHYDESLLVEDWDMYLRIASIGSLGFCDTIVSQYRIHGQNTVIDSQQNVGKYRLSFIKTFKNNVSRFQGINRLRLQALQLHFEYEALNLSDKKSQRLLWLKQLILRKVSSGCYRIKRFWLRRFSPRRC